jgi:Subtilase family/Clp amino terminal domain, pathogenicity island component
MYRILPVLAAVLFLGCGDELLAPMDYDQRAATFSATSLDSPESSKLRNAHLVPRAQSRGDVAGKEGSGKTNLFLALNTMEQDGVTRRILDEWGVTRRILDEYGVTRRVLDSFGLTLAVLEQNGVTRRVLESYEATVGALEAFGITRRILSEYSGSITNAFLAAYGVTEADLEAQGVTRRVLDEYGVSRRVLENYGLSPENLQKELDKFVSSIKLKVRIDKGVPGISIKVKDEDFLAFLNEILSDPDILFLEPDIELSGAPLIRDEKGRGNSQVVPWNIDRVGVQATDYDATGVEVYLLDSGVFGTDINLVERKDFTILFENRDQDLFDDDDFERLPYFDPGDSGNPADLSGHGTHLAGTLAAIDNQEGVLGVAAGARLHSLKVLTAEGRTDVTTVIAAIDYVIQAKLDEPNRPMVMNLSFGSDLETTAYGVVDEAVLRAIEAGIVVVVSAGNASDDAATYSPAHVTEALTVGSHGQSNRYSAFSNYGPLVDLFAPGEGIVSLSNDPADYGTEAMSVLNSGTSMAAPHVSGAAAQYLALHPSATVAEVHDALVSSARPDILDTPSGTTNRSLYLGEIARSGSGDKGFKTTKTEWRSGRGGNELKLAGEGRRADAVIYSDAATGAYLATAYVNSDGRWEIKIPLSSPPCEVVAEHNGTQLTAPVTEGRENNPLADCTSAQSDGPPAPGSTSVKFRKAEWKAGRAKELKIELEGPQGAEVELSYGASGDVLFTGTFGPDGRFNHKLKIRDEKLVPCTVAATSGGGVTRSAVKDAPKDCRN